MAGMSCAHGHGGNLTSSPSVSDFRTQDSQFPRVIKLDRRQVKASRPVSGRPLAAGKPWCHLVHTHPGSSVLVLGDCHPKA